MYNDEQQRKRRERAQAREHPLRTALLELLSVSGGKRELPATAICHDLSNSPPLSVVAYHLKVLVDAGLVETNSDDPTALYSMSP